MSIRPDSDMAWRADPYGVNNGPSNRMNPGGDVLGAYWLGRVSDLDDAQRNLSPHARAPLPYTRGTPEDEDAGLVEATPSGDSDGCGCRVGRSGGTPLVGLLAALLMLARAWHRH
jgi:MYXO-CTERM domain-containing protein